MARKKAHKRKKTKKTVNSAAVSTSPITQATDKPAPKPTKSVTVHHTPRLFDSTQTLILLIVAGIVIVVAVILLIQPTPSPSADPALSTQETTFSPVPLPGLADPNQLQSGTGSLQDGSAPGASQPSAGESLQPQTGATPEQLDKLQ